MKRAITILNFVGVLALAVLCAVQWTVDSRLRHQIDRLNSDLNAAGQKADEQGKTIADDAKALDELRSKLQIAQDGLDDAKTKLAVALQQRDELKIEADKWTAAVAERDAALKTASEQVQKVSAERNDAVEKYNEIVRQMNTGK